MSGGAIEIASFLKNKKQKTMCAKVPNNPLRCLRTETLVLTGVSRSCAPRPVFARFPSYRCISRSSLPSNKRKSIFCTPEQEIELAKNINAAGTYDPAATAGMNATTATSAASNTSAAAAATVSVGGNAQPIAPLAEKGSTRKKNAKSTAKHDESVSTAAAAPPPPPPAPQCLLWTDTVISTEGHPFLVSFIAAGGAAAATEDAAVADALATTATETTPATRSNAGTVDAPTGGHKLGENRSPPASPDTEDQHHHPSASTLASATPTTLAGDAAAAAAGVTGEGAEMGDISPLGRAMSILRHRRRQVKETTSLEFDPRQHYARAVNRKDLAKRPRNAELDVMVRAISPHKTTADT